MKITMTGYNEQNACYEGPDLKFSDGGTMSYDNACRAVFDVKFFGSYNSSLSSMIKGFEDEVGEQLGDEQILEIERLVDECWERLDADGPLSG